MIEEIKNKKLKWINIINPTSQDLEYLEKEYKFHTLDLDDCRSKVQRPKFEDYENYKYNVVEVNSEYNDFWKKKQLIEVTLDCLLTNHTN